MDELRAAAFASAKALPASAARSAYIFLTGVVAIVVLGVVEGLRPQVSDGEGGTEPLSMTITIQLVMFLVTALIIVFCRVKAQDITKASILTAGIVAIVALFGLAWMADTFISANQKEIVSALGGITKSAPWTFAIILFAVAALTTSQSGATRAIIPIGLALGIAPQLVVGMWPSVIGIYFFPANGSQIAAVQFDQTGTTKIGKAVVNHSFMPPLLIAWVVAVAVGTGIALLVYGTG